MQENTVPKDAFGNEMEYVESYGDYLPKSDHIPTALRRYGASGISHDGDIYCFDCAYEMGLITVEGNTIKAIVDGEITPMSEAPWTGIVLPSHETEMQYHCGCAENCLNAIDGDSHPYNHDGKIGIGIKQIVLNH